MTTAPQQHQHFAVIYQQIPSPPSSTPSPQFALEICSCGLVRLNKYPVVGQVEVTEWTSLTSLLLSTKEKEHEE